MTDVRDIALGEQIGGAFVSVSRKIHQLFFLILRRWSIINANNESPDNEFNYNSTLIFGF